MHLIWLALLKIGALAGDVPLADADDHPSKLSSLRGGGPALVVYEDRDANDENAHFKARLPGALGKVKLVAIADVGAWNFWPAKGFVKDALRSASKKAGITVWADWSGAGRKALDTRASRSNLILLDAAGKVLWSSAGALSSAQEEDLLGRIKAAGS